MVPVWCHASINHLFAIAQNMESKLIVHRNSFFQFGQMMEFSIHLIFPLNTKPNRNLCQKTLVYGVGVMVRIMVFNATFNNISAISWMSVLLVEKTGVPGENHRPATEKLYHIMLYRVNLSWSRFELTALVVIGTDCIDSCKSNYHTITTTTVPCRQVRFNMEHIEFMWHMLLSRGIWLVRSKIQAVIATRKPDIVTEVMSFFV